MSQIETDIDMVSETLHQISSLRGPGFELKALASRADTRSVALILSPVQSWWQLYPVCLVHCASELWFKRIWALQKFIINLASHCKCYTSCLFSV